MLKIGMFGLGVNGALHFSNMLHMDDVEVVAVADASKTALKRAKNAGIKHQYKDYNDLLKDRKDLDAIIISLPNFLHHDSIMKSLEAGLNVFVEKPMATKVWQCKEIVNLVEKTGLLLMVGHAMRYYDAIEKMKKITDAGRVGKLEFFTAESIMNGPLSHGVVPSPVPDWWFDPDRVGGGVLLDLGYHLIDLHRYFMGESKLIFQNFDHKYNLKVEDTATLILSSKNGKAANGFINVGWYQKAIFPEYDYRCIVHGDSGHTSTDDYLPKNMYYHAVKEGTKNFIRKISFQKIRPLSYTYFYESFYKELSAFFQSIKNDVETEVTAYDGLKTMEIIEEAYMRMVQ